MTDTPLYARWRAMLDRTSRPSHRGFENYGGRGVTVCSRWHRFDAFEIDMGRTFSPQLELDRIDVNGDYEPANCRWNTVVHRLRRGWIVDRALSTGAATDVLLELAANAPQAVTG
jgi:hypothetical protein